MQISLLPLVAACLCAPVVLVAAAQTSTSPAPDGDFHYRPDRQIVVYENGHMLTQEGGWSESNALRRYAAAHPTLAGGNFVLFQDAGGPIRQLTQPESLARVQATYAPMKALNAQQAALATQQKPLALQQSALATEMRAAGSPAQMTEIGQRQGKIGRQQGEIGHQQGVIGQQQGTVGRAFYAQLQSILDACLQNNTCPAVAAPDTATP